MKEFLKCFIPGEGRTSLFGRAGSANHSRGSSFAEEGYVPMAPGSNENYVEMDPKLLGRGNKSGMDML